MGILLKLYLLALAGFSGLHQASPELLPVQTGITPIQNFQAQPLMQPVNSVKIEEVSDQEDISNTETALAPVNQSAGQNSFKGLFTRGAGHWSKPEDEQDQSFFGKLTDPKSQRENWYSVTPYVGEFYCMISNAGFFVVGYNNNSWELLFAGSASVVSHTIPKQWLLNIDKLGVLIALSALVSKRDAILKKLLQSPTKPSKLIEALKDVKTSIKELIELLWTNKKVRYALLTAGAVNATDVIAARYYGQTAPHVVWHLSSAALSDMVLKELAKSKRQNNETNQTV